MKKARVLVCGDRHWSDRELIKLPLTWLPKGSTIIHGNAWGADKTAGNVAHELGLEVKSYPAEWKRYGKAAGPIRNKQMLKEGRPNLVLAFHADLSKSKGTANTIAQAREAGVRVIIVHGWTNDSQVVAALGPDDNPLHWRALQPDDLNVNCLTCGGTGKVMMPEEYEPRRCGVCNGKGLRSGV